MSTRTFPMSTLGDAYPEQGCLERRSGGGEVGAFDVAALEHLLGPAARLLGLLEVDLRRHVGGLGHHHDLVRQHLEEAADDRERLLVVALSQPQLARPSVVISGAWWGRT